MAIILVSRASGCYLDTQTLKNHPSVDPPKMMRSFVECQFQAYLISFHFYLILMALCMDIMLYFIEQIHDYGWNLSILRSPIKKRMPKNSTIAIFGHPVSKSWLRPWVQGYFSQIVFFRKCKDKINQVVSILVGDHCCKCCLINHLGLKKIT